MLEQGPLVGGGAVVKTPKDSGDWEFETGVQCLGGGDSLARHVKRLSLAFVPGTGVGCSVLLFCCTVVLWSLFLCLSCSFSYLSLSLFLFLFL